MNDQEQIRADWLTQPLMTREDLERFLGVSGRTIGRLLAEGKLPAPIFIGGSRRWRRHDVADFIEQQGHEKASLA